MKQAWSPIRLSSFLFLPTSLRRRCLAATVHHPANAGRPVALRRATSLIARLSSAGDVAAAHRLLLNLPAADAAAWNALIFGYAKNEHLCIAFQLFDEMLRRGLRPDAFTLSSLLKASSNAGLQGTQVVHGVGIKMGLNSSVFVIAGLVDNYSKAGELSSSEKCFEESLVLDPVVWTAMLSGYVKNEEFDLARGMFVGMWESGLELNQFCLASILAALADEGCSARQGKQIHCMSLKMGFLSGCSTPLSNALLSMYCKCGSEDESLRAFEEIKEPDVVSWSTLLGILDCVEALKLFKFLFSRGMDINEYTLINVLSAIDSPRVLISGRQIQAWCFKSGFLCIISIGNTLISMYGQCFQIDESKRIFDEMVRRDCVSWNALIAAYSTNCLPEPALVLFSEMRHSLLNPNISTLTGLLDAVSYFADKKHVTQIHSYVIKLGHISTSCMITTLMTVYGKCGGIEESKQVFSESSEIDIEHINAMIATFVQAGHHADALKLFKDAQSLVIDNSSLSVALKACCDLTSIEQGRNMHSLSLKLGIYQDNFVGSAMIDIYSKCGSLDEAIKVFDELPSANLASWNALITGYAQHGCYCKVIDQFEKMVDRGVDPDEITFLSVLYACCHGGHVKEAYTYLDSMLEDFGVVPSLEHYACIVDLLGRVGLLEEARRVIHKIPLNPDSRMWQIFLTACSIHGNVELGEVAARELLRLEPNNNSVYVLLSKIYAANGKWDEVRNMRRGMRTNTIYKEPGSSWIQLRGNFHSFCANDISHPQTPNMFLILDELNKQMIEPEIEEDGSSVQEQDSEELNNWNEELHEASISENWKATHGDRAYT